MRRWLTEHLFLPVARIGLRPDDSDEWRLRKMIGISTVVWTGIPFQLLIGATYLFFNEPVIGLVTIGFGLIMLLGVFSYALTRRFMPHNFLWLGIALVSPLSACLMLGGLGASGASFMWALLAPLLSLVTAPPRYVFFWLAAFVAALLAVLALQPRFGYGNSLPTWLISVMSVMNIALVSALLVLALYYFVVQNQRLLRLLNREREKSDNLLLNILPAEVAALLRETNDTIADHYAAASVLFADVVDFTPLSATLTPVELVEMLNQVFSAFDDMVAAYGLEKIKTIGDCYMVASGVPQPRSDHAPALVTLALQMRDYAGQHEFLGHRLRFRIGINSGPVVAGVIGHRKFIYDLWGDAVNTASRMESHGQAETIQITESTYDLIRDGFDCVPRGVITVKGKGEMKVWQVLRAKPAVTTA